MRRRRRRRSMRRRRRSTRRGATVALFDFGSLTLTFLLPCHSSCLSSPEVVNPVSPGGGRGDPRALVPSVETVMHVQQVVVSDVDLLQQRDGKGRKLLVDLKELDALHGWERQLMKTLMDKKVDEQQQSSLYEYVG
mmetsp:Transcript_44883/g.141322  ORF Transcript_44883/g.141322 Transcript_44883/m.141322 type:complete len:136 (-) Transcript_44883:134-541(-)